MKPIATVIGMGVGAVGVSVGRGAVGGVAQPPGVSKAMTANKGSSFFITVGFLLEIVCFIQGIWEPEKAPQSPQNL
jgi:hypothetical protein